MEEMSGSPIVEASETSLRGNPDIAASVLSDVVNKIRFETELRRLREMCETNG